MKLPGRSWLEFKVVGDAGGSLIRQAAIFDPACIGGLMYWYLVCPLHRPGFAGMLALFIAVTFAAAGLGAFFTSTFVSNWYPTLRKPSWNPPA
jgi:hypothetical protein